MKQGTSATGAVGFALAGYSSWVLADASLKVAGAFALPWYETVGLLGLSTAAVMAAVAAARGEVRSLWPRRPVPQMLRSLLDLGNNVCVLIALRHVPLAIFYILIFLAPMVTTVLARFALQEPLSWRQVAALLVGFAGVVVAVDPLAATRPGDRVGYLACLVCVACFSVNMVWSRRMTRSERPESMTFFSGAVIASLGGAATLVHAMPVPPRLVLVLAATGAFCVVGNLCFLFALKRTSAATVSQFHYSQLPTGALVAWLVWRERVTPAMGVGALLIAAAGVYTAAVQRRAPHVEPTASRE